MNRQIRLLGMILAVMLFALLINLSVQQVLLANSTKARAGNSRTLLEEYSRERDRSWCRPHKWPSLFQPMIR